MEKERLTCSISEAARIIGISPSAAYKAAERGEIPTARFGKRWVAPLVPLRRMLAQENREADAGEIPGRAA